MKIVMLAAAAVAIATPQPNAPAGVWTEADSPNSTSVSYRSPTRDSKSLLDFDCEQKPHYLRIDSQALSAKGWKAGTHATAILGGKAFDAETFALGAGKHSYISAQVKLSKGVLAALERPGPYGLVLKPDSMIALARPPIPGKWAPSPIDLIPGCTLSMNGGLDGGDDEDNN